MNRTVNNCFAEFDRELNLDRAQRDRAVQWHNDVRDVLKAAGYVEESFLQGSFARKTMLKPLKDIDIVIVLQASLWDQLRGPDGPGVAMNWFRGSVQERWPDARFDEGEEPSAKALRVTFPWLDFDIDLVPAFAAAYDCVLIGDREEGCWEPSNTRRVADAVSRRNQTTGGRFVHQVRQLKSLVKHQGDRLDFVKGIAVESLAYKAITIQTADKYAAAGCLEYCQTAVLESVLDPANDDDVTEDWTPEERKAASEVFADLAAKAAEALQLETDDDIEAAIDVWNSVFGEPFPEADTRAAEAVLAAWNTDGSRTSTGRPTTSTSGSQRTSPGRAWAPR